MDANFSSILNADSILEGIISLMQTIFEMLDSVTDAVIQFYDGLKDFNTTVMGMSTSPDASMGLPVMEAIGVVRYLVGDTVFYIMYICVLFGCLATILKLVVLLVEAKDMIIDQTKAGTSSVSLVSGLLRKLIH